MGAVATEAEAGWTVVPGDGQVTQLRVDYAFTLVLADGVAARLEEPFLLTIGGADQVRVPPGEVVGEVAAALPLFNMTVERITVERGGVLRFQFVEGVQIVVPVNEQYENWNLFVPEVGSWFGLPGGDVAFFPLDPEQAADTAPT